MVTGSQWGLAALSRAHMDLGKGEELANNRGPYVWTLTGRKTSGPWCAAAVYTWILRGAQHLRRSCPIARTHSARRLVGAVLAAGGMDTTRNPSPGDVILWRRGRNPKRGHCGLVDAVDGSALITIEGNVGRFPARVSFFPRSLADPKLLRIVRLPD